MSGQGVPSLRARLSAGDRIVGGLVRSPAEELIEMIAVAGFDFVLVDCEHGAPDLSTLRHQVTAAESFGLPVLVRTGADDDAFVLRALDLGVQGLVAPHVDSAAVAEALVRSAHYPPRGTRGFATYSRAGRYGSVGASQHRENAADVLMIAMIESPDAVRAAAQIVQVPGIDGYLIGTSDLGASRSDDDPSVAELVAEVHRATLGTGTARADLAAGAETARAAFEDGADLVVYNLTLAMMGLLLELRIEP